MINRLIDLYRLIPGAGRAIGWTVIILSALVLCYLNFGLVPTIVLAIAFLAIYGGAWLYRRMIERKKRQQGLAFGKAVGGAVGPSKEELHKQVSDLNQRWQEALVTFKNHEVNLYDLPWYMLIGEPGSGKSKTLHSSDLNFPLGKVAFSGTGGTKNCDWWFTDKGVILDTAGRFTIQDETATDPHEWDRFLELLIKHRPFCPINGVILVIPADSLLKQDRGEIESNAKAISQRLIQIQQKLSICYPVYVMITKCDLIYGFTQFFDQLPPSQQFEMFGWGQEELTEDSFDKFSFIKAFDGILSRIRMTRLKSLSQSHATTAEKTFVFPEEFSSIKEPLECYLKSIFTGNAFRQPLQFRGFYFSSATQEGKPIVKACKDVIPDGDILQDLSVTFQNKRSFFVKDFYSEKVFPEEGLVTRGPKFQKDDKRKIQLLYGVNAALVLFGLVFAWFMWNGLNKRVSKPKVAINQTAQLLDTVKDDIDFFNRDYRTDIFTSLKNLQNGVTSARAPGFTFFKGRKNKLTENLDSTFAVLYLDRFLLGMFERVDRQLRYFKLEESTGNSSKDLTILCDAFSNLQAWRVALAEDKLDSFKPKIEPFIALVYQESWEEELMKPRGTEPVTQILGNWFTDVYEHASPSVRRILITQMVERAQQDNLFSGLHNRVMAFYEDQGELELFKDKIQILNDLEKIWARFDDEPNSIDDYHENLDDLAEYFETDNRNQMSRTGDIYLSFEEIRTRVIEAMGKEYVSLDQEEQLSDKAKNLISRPRQDDVVAFVRELRRLETPYDPRQDYSRDSDEKTPINYPKYILDFWDKVALPYQEYRQNRSAYDDLYRDGDRLERKIERLLDAGLDRVGLADEYWKDTIADLVNQMPREKNTKDFEKATSSFAALLREREQDLVSNELGDLIRNQNTRVPKAPKKWEDFVTRLNRLSYDEFDEMTRMPEDIIDLLEDDFRRQLERLYDGASPVRGFSTYARDVKRAMGSLHQAVIDLDNVEQAEMAEDPSYRNLAIPQAAKMREPRNIRGVPKALGPHYAAVRKWSDVGMNLFKQRAGNAEECPSCKDDYQSLIASIDRVGNGFPIYYNGQTVQKKVGIGQIEITANLATMENLEKLFRKIDQYRDLGDEEEDYLLKKGKLKWVKQAVEWADAVEKLINDEIVMEYSIEYLEESGEQINATNIQEVFTFATMEGGYEARRISLNSPRLTKIKKANNTDDFTVIRFHDKMQESRTQQVESVMTIRQGRMGLLAWVFDGSRPRDQKNQRMKVLILPLHKVANQEVKGLFILQTSQTLPEPPNWDKLKDLSRL